MVTDSYLDKLNPAQRAAVEYIGGPELVIAGAGSGKTRVLTYKIVHLLANGLKPWNILALTFTNKAAKEMRERIAGLTGEETASKLWMGTFHSIFSRILRIHAERLGFDSNFTIYDAADSKSLVKTIIKEMLLDDKIYRPGHVLAEISNAKNNLVSPQEYNADRDIERANKESRQPCLGEIYSRYTDRCRIAGAMDFDDLLFFTYRLLKDNEDIREHYRSFFAYILVDEYQDTNFAQHKIVRMLCGDDERLCVVGDDAQSIYSFRGANIRNILDLNRSFPRLQTFKLEQNYRSTKNIIGAANTLIAANSQQIAKEVFSQNDEGERIEVLQCSNDYEEAYSVAARIAQVRRMHSLSYSDIAVLYRTNAQSRVIEEALRNRNIPYRVYGGLAFYQRKEVKDAVAYFRLAVNPCDDEAFRRVINTPKRGIGDTTVKKLLAAAMESRCSMIDVAMSPSEHSLSLTKATAAKLSGFAEMIHGFHEMVKSGDVAAEVAREIYNKTGIMREYEGQSTPENISKRDNLSQLYNGVTQFTDGKLDTEGPEQAGLPDYIASISLLTDQDEERSGDSVVLMTIHSAKGLEFDAVFIVGVEENLLPSEMSLRSQNAAQEIEEERRLMYVALTRAKLYCNISYAGQRQINGKFVQTFPSRFLHDIDGHYLRLMGGSRLGPRRYKPERKEYTYNDILTPAQPRKVTEVTKPRPVTFGGETRSIPTPASGEFSVHAPGELEKGQRIQHSVFGLGTVEKVDTSADEARLVVSFTDGEKRTLLLKFARFKIL